MTQKGFVIVTESHLQISFTTPKIMVVDYWNEVQPIFDGFTVIQVEPKKWWVIADDMKAPELEKTVADNGAITPIGGGLLRASLKGERWREALMVGGWFDAENAEFSCGATAATLLHHIPVWLHVSAPHQCDVYYAASYDETMNHHFHAISGPHR